MNPPSLREVTTNPRLRAGLWLVLAILWGYGILLLQDAVASIGAEHAILVKKLARATAIARDDAWPGRVEAARARLLENEKRLWRAESAGQAQARFRDWGEQTLRQANVPNPKIDVAAVQEFPAPPSAAGNTSGLPPGDLWKITARINFDFVPQSFNAFLRLLETHQPAIVVESLTIRGALTLRVEMAVTAYAQRPTTNILSLNVMGSPSAPQGGLP